MARAQGCAVIVLKMEYDSRRCDVVDLLTVPVGGNAPRLARCESWVALMQSWVALPAALLCNWNTVPSHLGSIASP